MKGTNPMNMSIECEVTECKYNNELEKYCMLNKIKVVKHDGAANSIELTDCSSFEPR
jgi:ribosomal protein L30E